ncbi:50S ribosomal protein L35ae [Candidatus Pacearchaeota archaeon]|nr:50S ribosomal protein L35ae [Candidatus Pacearchaeota archaeon]
MKGIIVQFRRSRHRIKEKHYLLDLGFTTRDEAKKLAGKVVIWKSVAGKEIKGMISDAHGNKGLVRAIFESGLPGQAITTEIEVLGLSGSNADQGKGGKK